jgi:hypothetical protein
MKLRNTLLAAGAAFALTCSSYALSIYDVNAMLGDGTVVLDTNTPDTDYKFDVPGTESGAVDTFATVISNGGLTATVTWSPTGSVSVSDIYLKAGNDYIYWDTSAVDWSTYDGFSITNDQIFNAGSGNAKAISHISVNGGGSSVPDGGATVVLLGLGLVGMSVIARRRLAA